MSARTCPKCASTNFQRVPDLPTAAQRGHKLPGGHPVGAGHVIDEAPSFASAPQTVQCTGCGDYWHESDLDATGASFSRLRSEYAKTRALKRGEIFTLLKILEEKVSVDSNLAQ